jgi:hypothetical protein
MYSRKNWYRVASQIASIMGEYEVFEAANTMDAYRCVYRIEGNTRHTFFFSDNKNNWRLDWDACVRWLESRRYELLEWSRPCESLVGFSYYVRINTSAYDAFCALNENKLIARCDAFLRMAGCDFDKIARAI